jgi:hypothetical protein
MALPMTTIAMMIARMNTRVTRGAKCPRPGLIRKRIGEPTNIRRSRKQQPKSRKKSPWKQWLRPPLKNPLLKKRTNPRRASACVRRSPPARSGRRCRECVPRSSQARPSPRNRSRLRPRLLLRRVLQLLCKRRRLHKLHKVHRPLRLLKPPQARQSRNPRPENRRPQAQPPMVLPAPDGPFPLLRGPFRPFPQDRERPGPVRF